VRLHGTLPLLKVQRASSEKRLSETCLGRDGDVLSRFPPIVIGWAQFAVPVKGDPIRKRCFDGIRTI